MKDKLFPGLPHDLASLTPEELEAKLSEYRAIVAKVAERDPETIGDLTMAQVLDAMQVAVEEIEKLTTELEERGKVDEEFETKLAEMTAKAGLEVKAEGDEPAPEGEGDDAEVAAETETETLEVVGEAEVGGEVVEVVDAEAVAASAARMARKPALPRPSKDHEPVEMTDTTPGFVASAGIPGVEADTVLDRHALANSIMKKREQSTSTAPGVTEKVVVASARYGDQWPEERRLRGDKNDQAKIDALVSPEALLASGGLCAPVQNYYEIRNWSTAARPARNALVGMNAVRGGLKFTQGITFAEITEEDGGIGIKTAAEDAAGGTTAEKSCQVIECPEFDEVQLDMIYKCLQFGNLNSRAWPEMVAAFVDAAAAAHASLAETSILDQMKDFSVEVDGTEAYGAFSSLLYSIILGAEGMRSAHRLDDNVTIRALLPRWTAGLLITDLINSNYYRFDKTREGVVQAIRELANVEVSFVLDGATGDGQVFAAQGAGTQLKFPTTIKFFLYPEGSFLFLDGGQLDLGIVRDSVLNNTNDYRMFAETFEVVAYIGIASQYITTTVCPTGAGTPNAAALITC
jgi:hypothetical protein